MYKSYSEEVEAFRASVMAMGEIDPAEIPRRDAALQWLSENPELVQSARKFHLAPTSGLDPIQAMALPLRPAAEALVDDASLALVAHFTVGPGLHTDTDMIAHTMSEMLMWAMRWHAMGRPVVALLAGQAASLGMTDVGLDMADALHAPWPGFEIKVPPGEIRIELSPTVNGITGTTQPGGTVDLDRIWVSAYQGEPYDAGTEMRGYHRGRWNIYLPLPNGIELHAGVRSITELIDYTFIDSGAYYANKLDELEVRAVRIATRIALSTMLAITTHGRARRGHRKNGPKGKRRVFTLSGAATDFVLGTPVVLGLEAEVNEYLSGVTGQTRKTRWSTRGHWRLQPYGPRAELRRPTWIAPHWNSRGPERLRNYVLGESTVTTTPEKLTP